MNTKKLMWMEVHIYSVKATSQRYNDNKKRPEQKENQLEILKFTHFARNLHILAEGFGSRTECC